jgi:hypothetical protein
MAKRGGRSGRRYVRDNRGRFATTGATARGGRLKTAGGKKRATQTVKAKTGSKPAGTLKAKPRSEGQKYAKRVQAGKDLKRSQSTAREKKFFAETQKRLDAAPLAQSRAAKPAAAKRKATPNSKTDYTRELLGLKRKTTRLSGTDYVREIGRAKGNKRIKNLNQQIKEAGPNAAGLRLEKLNVQTRMPSKPRQRAQPTAKQLAKEASRNDAIRKRSAELRAQSARLAEAKVTKPAKPKRRRS